MVLDMQTERFPDLEALRARLLLDLEPACCPFGEAVAHAFPLRPIHSAEDLKAPGRFGFEGLEMLQEDVFAPAAIQVNVMNNACFIQQVQQFP